MRQARGDSGQVPHQEAHLGPRKASSHRSCDVDHFNVGEVCDELRLDSPHRYSVCCNVLDAEDFAHRERVDYHHRTGVWGTGDATYIFQLRSSSRRSESTFDGLSITDWAKLLLVVGLACVVLRGGSNDKF